MESYGGIIKPLYFIFVQQIFKPPMNSLSPWRAMFGLFLTEKHARCCCMNFSYPMTILQTHVYGTTDKYVSLQTSMFYYQYSSICTSTLMLCQSSNSANWQFKYTDTVTSGKMTLIISSSCILTLIFLVQLQSSAC